MKYEFKLEIDKPSKVKIVLEIFYNDNFRKIINKNAFSY